MTIENCKMLLPDIYIIKLQYSDYYLSTFFLMNNTIFTSAI